MSEGKKLESNPDWLRLQSKIFSRWVGQKLGKRGIKVNDVVKEAGDGVILINLLEVLSEASFPDRKQFDNLMKKPPTGRVQKIDIVNSALKFIWNQGVEMKIKPSAEAIVDGDEKKYFGAYLGNYVEVFKIWR